MKTSDSEIQYERNLNFSLLTSWLHSYRYKEAIHFFQKLSRDLGRPLRILEIGAAHGKLYGLLSALIPLDYVGVELDQGFCEAAWKKYGERENFRLIHGSCMDDAVYEGVHDIDVVIALETLEHMPEHDVVRLVERIAEMAPPYFICSVPVEVGPSIWFKNVGSFLTGYVRHREYTWSQTLWAGLDRLDKLPAHGTGHRGFDWRWLAQTIRHNFTIQKMARFPVDLLPGAFATTVFFIATPGPRA